MLRTKVPGGHLTGAQARKLSELAERYGHGFCDITTRQTVQMHWLRIEDMPQIFAELADVGVTTSGACGDDTRNVGGCPLAGVDKNEIIDGTAQMWEVSRALTNNREFSNLPRKYKITISGCCIQCSPSRTSTDVGVFGVRKPDGETGFGDQGRRRPVRRARTWRKLLPVFHETRAGLAGDGSDQHHFPRQRLPAQAQPRAFQVSRGRLGRGPHSRRGRTPPRLFRSNATPIFLSSPTRKATTSASSSRSSRAFTRSACRLPGGRVRNCRARQVRRTGPPLRRARTGHRPPDQQAESPPAQHPERTTSRYY